MNASSNSVDDAYVHSGDNHEGADCPDAVEEYGFDTKHDLKALEQEKNEKKEAHAVARNSILSPHDLYKLARNSNWFSCNNTKMIEGLKEMAKLGEMRKCPKHARKRNNTLCETNEFEYERKYDLNNSDNDMDNDITKNDHHNKEELKKEHERMGKGLKSYYKLCGAENQFIDSTGISKFNKFLEKSELDNPEYSHSIKEQFNDECIENCVYQMYVDKKWGDPNFPIPPNINVPRQCMEKYAYYIIKYIFDHRQSPTIQYIKETIIPIVVGSIGIKKLSKKEFKAIYSSGSDLNIFVSENNIDCTKHLKYFGTAITNIIFIDNVCQSKGKSYNTSLIQHEIPYIIDDETYIENEQSIKISIPRIMTKENIPNIVKIAFFDEVLYKHMIHHDQVCKPKYLKRSDGRLFRITNYGFLCKQNNETLFCLWQWNNEKWTMMQSLFTSKQLQITFNIPYDKLPLSLAEQPLFRKQLNILNKIENLTKDEHGQIFEETKFDEIPVHKRRDKQYNTQRITLTIDKQTIVKELNKYISNQNDLIIIPIVISDDNQTYHIEYVHIVELRNQSMGISYKYDSRDKNINLTAIYLHKEFIQQKQLLTPQNNWNILNHFKSILDDLIIEDPNKRYNQINSHKQRDTSKSKKNRNSKKSTKSKVITRNVSSSPILYKLSRAPKKQHQSTSNQDLKILENDLFADEKEDEWIECQGLESDIYPATLWCLHAKSFRAHPACTLKNLQVQARSSLIQENANKSHHDKDNV